MVYTLDALHRYPMVSRISFLECGGNSAPLYSKEPIQANVQALHGLCSCAEWTGVMLCTLLEEVGVDPKAKWFFAEGADLPTMIRSIPLAKAMDDAMIALYQNGERLNPANGYPLRLLLPGYEGNMNVKWLRRIKLVERPVMAINETKQYTILRPDGKAWQFYFPQEVKSFITHPSPGLNMKGPGFYEISGISFSGNGRIAKVEVSADGGKSWARGGAAGAGSEQGVHPLPYAVELGWGAGGPAKPRDRRGRQRAADARGVHCRAWSRPCGYAQRGGVHHGALQRHHQLGHRCERRGEPCLCVRQLALAAALALGLSVANAADAPRFGQPIAPADLAPWDISIAPDGVGLPPGSGTPAQGATVYAERGCALCHGEKGAGDRAALWSAAVRSTALTAIRSS